MWAVDTGRPRDFAGGAQADSVAVSGQNQRPHGGGKRRNQTHMPQDCCGARWKRTEPSSGSSGQKNRTEGERYDGDDRPQEDQVRVDREERDCHYHRNEDSDDSSCGVVGFRFFDGGVCRYYSTQW